MTESLYIVSDSLKGLREVLAREGRDGLTLKVEQIATLTELLLALENRSRLMSHEISRHRSRLTGPEDRQDLEALQAELNKPDTNLRLLAHSTLPLTEPWPWGTA